MTSLEILIATGGDTRMIFSDHFDLRSLGQANISRASHVEPNAAGQWTANLTLLQGPLLGPFDRRQDALAAEVSWLQQNWLIRTRK